MKLVDPRAVIESARQGGYAVGAFNMHNEETTEALVWAAETVRVSLPLPTVPPASAAVYLLPLTPVKPGALRV